MDQWSTGEAASSGDMVAIPGMYQVSAITQEMDEILSVELGTVGSGSACALCLDHT